MGDVYIDRGILRQAVPACLEVIPCIITKTTLEIVERGVNVHTLVLQIVGSIRFLEIFVPQLQVILLIYMDLAHPEPLVSGQVTIAAIISLHFADGVGALGEMLKATVVLAIPPIRAADDYGNIILVVEKTNVAVRGLCRFGRSYRGLNGLGDLAGEVTGRGVVLGNVGVRRGGVSGCIRPAWSDCFLCDVLDGGFLDSAGGLISGQNREL